MQGDADAALDGTGAAIRWLTAFTLPIPFPSHRVLGAEPATSPDSSIAIATKKTDLEMASVSHAHGAYGPPCGLTSPFSKEYQVALTILSESTNQISTF